MSEETRICSKCHRQGCFTQAEDDPNYWICKCGHEVEVSGTRGSPSAHSKSQFKRMTAQGANPVMEPIAPASVRPERDEMPYAKALATLIDYTGYAADNVECIAKYLRQYRWGVEEDCAREFQSDAPAEPSSEQLGEIMSELQKVCEELLNTCETDFFARRDGTADIVVQMDKWNTWVHLVRKLKKEITPEEFKHLRGADRELAIHRQDCPKIWDFYEKHSLGPKAPPSCFVCGKSMQGEKPAIQHMELADIVCCAACTSPDAGHWMPIESAPKRRTVFVGYHNSLGNWRSLRACYYEADMIEDWGDQDQPEGWYEEPESAETVFGLDHPPTHWMPLPPAPAAPREEK